MNKLENKNNKKILSTPIPQNTHAKMVFKMFN